MLSRVTDPAAFHEPPSMVDVGISEDLKRVGYTIVTDFLGKDLSRRLAAELTRARDAGHFRAAGVGRGTSWRLAPEVRTDRVEWIDAAEAGPAECELLARFEELRLALNRELCLGLFDFEAHRTLYPPGAFYRTHLDRFASSSLRTVSLIAYLNPDWHPADGGELRLYIDGDPDGASLDVLPRAGTLVAFVSDRIPHEVLVTRRERLSITGWMKRRP